MQLYLVPCSSRLDTPKPLIVQFQIKIKQIFVENIPKGWIYERAKEKEKAPQKQVQDHKNAFIGFKYLFWKSYKHKVQKTCFSAGAWNFLFLSLKIIAFFSLTYKVFLELIPTIPCIFNLWKVYYLTFRKKVIQNCIGLSSLLPVYCEGFIRQ